MFINTEKKYESKIFSGGSKGYFCLEGGGLEALLGFRRLFTVILLQYFNDYEFKFEFLKGGVLF